MSRSLQRKPVPSLPEIAQSITLPLYLRPVQPLELPNVAEASDLVWPKYAVFVQAGNTEFPPQWKQQLLQHGTQIQVLDLAKQPDKATKKLVSWLAKSRADAEKKSSILPQRGHNSSVSSQRNIVMLDGLALSAIWQKQAPHDAALSLSVMRLHLIQSLADDAVRMRWLVCTSMGLGAFVPGFDAKPSLSEPTNTVDLDASSANQSVAMNVSASLLLGGATSGFFKSLAQERRMPCRCLHLGTSDMSKLSDAALSVELLDSSDIPEIVYDQGKRFSLILGEEDTLHPSTPHVSPQPNSITNPSKDRTATSGTFVSFLSVQPTGLPVVVITGGASGITARMVEALAQHLQFRALLLGRTKLPAPEQRLPLADKAQTRRILKERLDKDATPKQLQEALQQAEKQAQLARQIEHFESLGIECLYIPTDMCDVRAVETAIQQALQRWGRIDAVIHGAGVDLSRDVMQKTPSELELVMGTKMQGLAHLRRALVDHPVKLWLALGSVSARFGNIGQTDYAAANEAMTRWLVGDPSWGQTLVVDYTGWEDVGMAASLARFMKERGVDMLSPIPTAAHTIGWWLHGCMGEWVYAGRFPSPLDLQHTLGQLVCRVPGREVRYQKPLVSGAEAFLQDHKMGDTEIQPGVVSLAWMQLCAEEIAQNLPCGEIRDIIFQRALKIFPKHPVVMEVHAQRIGTTTHAPDSIQTRLDSQRTRRGLHEHIHHASATCFPGSCLTIPDFAQELLAYSVQDLLEDTDISTIYQTFFHGPTWQVLAQAWLHESVCIVSSPPQSGCLGQGIPEASRYQAVAQELALQGAGLWSLRQQHTFALPFAIQRLCFFASPDPNGPWQARLRFLRQEHDDLFFQGIILDQHGRLLQSIDGLIMRRFPL